MCCDSPNHHLSYGGYRTCQLKTPIYTLAALKSDEFGVYAEGANNCGTPVRVLESSRECIETG